MKTRIALESYLATIASPLPTEYENVSYTPINDVPYQSVHLMRNDVNDITVAYNDKVINSGIFQIMLKYPISNGANIAETKAYAIRDHFQRGTVITNTDDGVLVIDIKETPDIRVLGVSGNRFLVVVSVPYFIFG